MPLGSLRDKLDGSEIDLSLCNLTDVPVDELKKIPEATHLDLSCNQLQSLPNSFVSLTHVVKLDLSKNQLTSLPQDFGQLVNLQHLDLLDNGLTTLPDSFSQLTRLTWLDLKGNPLTEVLKKEAGKCGNEQECKQCAQNVLAYMKNNSGSEKTTGEKKRETIFVRIVRGFVRLDAFGFVALLLSFTLIYSYRSATRMLHNGDGAATGSARQAVVRMARHLWHQVTNFNL